AFSGKVLSKGRLNAYNALTYIILKPAFTSTGTVGEKPFTVDFTDNSQGYIAQRRWDFGDGGVSSEKNPTHIYRKSGSYTVRLTVKNPYVVKKITKEQMIRVVDNLLIISN